MLSRPALVRLAYRLSPRTWLLIAALSGMLFISAALVLAMSAGMRLPEPLAGFYDTTELFLRDTVRLTFKTDRQKNQPLVDVFVAPVGILEKDTVFHWVDTFTDFGRPSENSAPAPTAPVRLLDPDWRPDFRLPELKG